ncbi:MAG: putative 2-aminoethylphosphonate ABC transporter ATP-binding protein, partial [Acetobacteraceae bacterium]
IHDTTGLTTVFVTHDQDEAMELADLVVVMSGSTNGGRIEQIGKPQDIRAKPATPFVREFLGA